MTEPRAYHGYTLYTEKQEGNRICYMILPEGLIKDVANEFLKNAAQSYGCSMVAITGIDWNSDLTPWQEDPVFKSEKEFHGKAAPFLKCLEQDIFLNVEQMLGIKKAERYICGVSLSGLFALWAAHSTGSIRGIASISGSFWYTQFDQWIIDTAIQDSISKVFISLGDKEKESKNRNFARIQDCTETIVEALRKKAEARACRADSQELKVEYQLFQGSHFSPIVPNLENAFEFLFL